MTINVTPFQKREITLLSLEIFGKSDPELMIEEYYRRLRAMGLHVKAGEHVTFEVHR